MMVVILIERQRQEGLFTRDAADRGSEMGDQSVEWEVGLGVHADNECESADDDDPNDDAEDCDGDDDGDVMLVVCMDAEFKNLHATGTAGHSDTPDDTLVVEGCPDDMHEHVVQYNSLDDESDKGCD